MTDINVGDQFKIEKGVRVFDFGYGLDEATGIAEAKRAVSAKVTNIIKAPDNWVTFLNAEEQEQIISIFGRNLVSHVLHWLKQGFVRRNNGEAAHQKLTTMLAEFKLLYDERFGPNPIFVLWSNDTKGALLRDVAKVEPVVKVVKEQKITKRRQMVVGSRWKLTEDRVITREITNPEINRLITFRDRTARTKTEQDKAQDQINLLLRTHPRIRTKAFEIMKDSIIKIKLKPTTSYYDGFVVEVDLEEGKIEVGDLNATRWFVPCNQIEPVIEALEIPETIVYVLRDSATGDFFGGWETDSSGRIGDVPKMVKTFSSSKKYKTSSAAKASVRDFTGYTDGMTDEGGAADWVGIGYAAKKIDLPETWELVAIDKTTNAEKQIIDLQAWYRELMRLRELTVLHGSGLRAAYKKAEGHPEIDTIVVVTHLLDGTVARFSYGLRNGEHALKHIADARQKAISGKSYVTSTPATVAVACDVMDATLFILAITDPCLSVAAYDIATLTETLTTVNSQRLAEQTNA